MHIVPDQDWVAQAKAKFDQIAAVVAYTDKDDALLIIHMRYDLLGVLVHATLAGASREDLVEIAKIAAAVVFLPGAAQ